MISKTNRLAMLGVLASLIAISHADGDCGARNQAPCEGEPSCEEGLVVYTYTNSDSETVTVCSPCGRWNRLPCTAEGTEPCSAGLAVDTQGKVATAGTCIGCGTNKRPVCTHDGEEPCENGYYEEDGYCYTCGIEGAAFCEGQNKCLPGFTPMLDGTEACTRCGNKDKPACANPNESPCGNGLGVNEDSGLCEYCGTAGKPGCETTCEPCRTGLALDSDGLCQYCGWNKRVWCTNQGEDICRNGLTPAEDGTCQACGSNGKPQCGIMGTHLAEVWEFNGESGESFDITGTAFSFKAVADDQYRVTKEPRGNNYLGGAASMEYILRNITEPETFDLDFEFPFYGTNYSSLCLSSQGHIVFPDTEGLFTGCELIDTDTPITLETHYNAKRISFSFDHWTPSCGDKGLGCMHARKGVLEDGRKFFTVNMLNVPDVSNPAYDLNVAQVQTRIMSDGEIQMYTRWSRSRDGLMGISPGYAPLNYEEVNFSGEFCNPRTTPLADGTCATCGGKNQPICENSKSDEPCRNNYVEETDEDGKKTGLCVRA